MNLHNEPVKVISKSPPFTLKFSAILYLSSETKEHCSRFKLPEDIFCIFITGIPSFCHHEFLKANPDFNFA